MDIFVVFGISMVPRTHTWFLVAVWITTDIHMALGLHQGLLPAWLWGKYGLWRLGRFNPGNEPLFILDILLLFRAKMVMQQESWSRG